MGTVRVLEAVIQILAPISGAQYQQILISQFNFVWLINFGQIAFCGLLLNYTSSIAIAFLRLVNVLSQQWLFVSPEQHKGLNSLRPRPNRRHFADDIFKCIFENENVWIPIKISLKYVLKCPINNIPALVQIMAWRRPGDKPLSEPMMVNLRTHICVTRPQWVKETDWVLGF